MTADLAKFRADTLALIGGYIETKAGADTLRLLDEIERLTAENEGLRDATNQCRLAFAGFVSADSAIRKLDALPKGGPDDR